MRQFTKGSGCFGCLPLEISDSDWRGLPHQPDPRVRCKKAHAYKEHWESLEHAEFRCDLYETAEQRAEAFTTALRRSTALRRDYRRPPPRLHWPLDIPDGNAKFSLK